MKKYLYICIIVTVGIMFFLQTRTNSNFTNYILSEPLRYNSDLATVEMLARRVVQSHNFIHAKIINNTEFKISLENNFTLEFFDGTNWRIAPMHGEQFITPGELPLVLQNEIRYVMYSLDIFYPFPKADLFRIRVKISIVEDYFIITDATRDLVMEFSFDMQMCNY